MMSRSLFGLDGLDTMFWILLFGLYGLCIYHVFLGYGFDYVYDLE